jgi:hypothetical protein
MPTFSIEETPRSKALLQRLARTIAIILALSPGRMLSLLQRDQLPGINEEGATGKLDNKGAIFVPGGLIYQDVDEK